MSSVSFIVNSEDLISKGNKFLILSPSKLLNNNGIKKENLTVIKSTEYDDVSSASKKTAQQLKAEVVLIDKELAVFKKYVKLLLNIGLFQP